MSRDLIMYVEDRKDQDRRNAIAPDKTKVEPGWEPGFTFDGGIRKTIEWCLEKMRNV